MTTETTSWHLYVWKAMVYLCLLIEDQSFKFSFPFGAFNAGVCVCIGTFGGMINAVLLQFGNTNNMDWNKDA